MLQQLQPVARRASDAGSIRVALTTTSRTCTDAVSQSLVTLAPAQLGRSVVVMSRLAHRHAVIVSVQPHPQQLLTMMMMMMMVMMIASAVQSAGKLLSFGHHCCMPRSTLNHSAMNVFLTHNSTTVVAYVTVDCVQLFILGIHCHNLCIVRPPDVSREGLKFYS